MPQDYKATQHAPGGRPIGYKGALADKKFDTEAEIAEKKQRQAFEREKGYWGIAGAARKPKPDIYAKEYAEWKKVKAKAKGQDAALAKVK